VHKGRIVEKVLYLRKSAQTKTSWRESEERRPGNPMRGSSLQKVHGNEAEKPGCSGCPAVLTAGGSGSLSRDAPTIIRHNKHAAILGSHSLVALCIFPSRKGVALRSLAQAAKTSSVPTMRETLWEIACDQKGYMYSENGNRSRRLAAPVVVSCSETSEERRVKSKLAKEAIGTRCG